MRKGCCEATIRGFGLDQCEKDVAKQPSEGLLIRGCCEATIRGFGLDQCEEDVAKQPSEALGKATAKRMRPSGAILFGLDK